MEKEENLKVPFLETADDNYLYFIDKSLPFSNQVIYKDDNECLLNVRKIYTDNIYFGVSYTILNFQLGMQHHFKCKDRPLGELSVVEDKDKFLSIFLSYDYVHKKLQPHSKHEEVLFNLPYKVFFCFNKSGRYIYTQYILDDGRILRGLYEAKNKEQLKIRLIEFSGFATLGPPTKKEVIAYYEDKMTSYANNQISVSTDYSKIIIEHSTQYDQDWSDIKRRKKWVKKHQ